MVKSDPPAGKTAKSAITAAFINVDKPQGITSHDVVHRVRKLTGIKQVGHAGTLDPMATGVMVVAVGKACRLLRFLEGDKSYLATIKLGLATDTDDIEGKILAENPQAVSDPPDRAAVLAALSAFKGEIEQIPPYFSAIHVDGKRLYEMARAGLAPPEIKARPVTIHKLELVSYEAPDVVIRVHCSKGTYIRSIARDLGLKLGLGGTLSALRRESSGRFQIERSQTVEQLAQEIIPLAIEEALTMPALTVDDDTAKKLSMGQKVVTEMTIEQNFDSGENSAEQYILISAASSKKPFSVCRFDPAEKLLSPEVVFGDV